MAARLRLLHAALVRLHTLNGHCYPHTGNGGHSWCLSSSLSLLVGFSIQDEAIDVARPAPQEAAYHSDVIYFVT